MESMSLLIFNTHFSLSLELLDWCSPPLVLVLTLVLVLALVLALALVLVLVLAETGQ